MNIWLGFMMHGNLHKSNGNIHALAYLLFLCWAFERKRTFAPFFSIVDQVNYLNAKHINVMVCGSLHFETKFSYDDPKGSS